METAWMLTHMVGITRGAETLHDNEEERRVQPRTGANDGESDVDDDIRNLFGVVLGGQANESQNSSGGQNANLEKLGTTFWETTKTLWETTKIFGKTTKGGLVSM